ncbi:MAG: nucleoside monophosphate kinase [Actinomycetota bacterium]|jgi:adenylate kinase|nr:nucleoside monophosphate kinase [Actinomycetota bacterium]
MKLVLIGPPGAGKGTQGQRLSRLLSYFHVSTGNLVRAHIQAWTDFGREVEGYNRRGEFVPDDLVVKMIEPSLEPAGRWILDGFPRTGKQARSLDEALERRGIHLSRAIFLDAPDDILTERIKGRRYSQATGWTYHLEHDPPPQPEQHLDPGPFVRREDDMPDIVRRQLELYHEETEPLKKYYGEKGCLETVDGTRSIIEVTEDICAALGNPDKNNS